MKEYIQFTTFDVPNRLSYFELGSMEIEYGPTFNDASSTWVPAPPITVTFTDDCRTAEVVEQDLTFLETIVFAIDQQVEWNLPLYADTYDDANSCKNKTFSLIDPPEFLTWTQTYEDGIVLTYD